MQTKTVVWLIQTTATVTLDVPANATDEGLSKVLPSLVGIREIADEAVKQRFRVNISNIETLLKITAPVSEGAVKIALPPQKQTGKEVEHEEKDNSD